MDLPKRRPSSIAISSHRHLITNSYPFRNNCAVENSLHLLGAGVV